MPLYDMHCEVCNVQHEIFCFIADRETQTCPACGFKLLPLITAPGDNRDWFREGWFDDFGYEPIYVRSKEHLKELCKQYGCYSKALGPAYSQHVSKEELAERASFEERRRCQK